MILHALKDYYERMRADRETRLSEFGFSKEPISFALIISKDGKHLQIDDVRNIVEQKTKSGKSKTRKEPRIEHVPSTTETDSRSGQKPPPNFLWDNSGYMLGMDEKTKPELLKWKFAEFKNLHVKIANNYGLQNEEGIKAVLSFLDSWDPSQAKDLQYWDEIAKGANLAFRLDGDGTRFIHERPAVIDAWKRYVEDVESGEAGVCLMTGEDTEIARIHRKISGVWKAQPTGAAIVSFNQDSFESYGKSQSLNSPISVKSAFAYTTALNHLLRTNDRKVQIGDATTVFWAEKSSPMEDLLGQIFNPQAEDTGTVSDVRNFLEAVRQGKMPSKIDTQTKFYILGLSPNASRLSVRFWYAGTVGELSERIGKHFRDIEIEKSRETDKDFPGMWQLLIQTAVQGKTDNIPPLLGGELMRSILTGGKYPESMLSALIGRIRADAEINYLRVAMIKGILTRNHNKEVSMSWDGSRKEPAYLLGGLFAILEKTQKDAGIETIREKYFRSASATPKIAFSVLMPLAQHHIAKADFGIEDDKRIAELMEDIKEFPAYLSLQEQGLFSIGYYHMRNKIWKEIMEASAAKKAKSNQ